MQTNLPIKTTGAAAVSRTATKNPLELLMRFTDAHPDADVEWLFKKWRTAVMADDDLLVPVLRHTFTNLLSSIDRSKTLVRRHQNHAAARERVQREAVEIAERVTTVVLMNLQLPNGKTLRDATFKECAQAGGFFLKVAKRGRAQQIVGQVLTEDDLRAIK